MSKHTPGPWFAEYDDNGFYYIHGGETGKSDIAHVIGEGPFDKANAHLIAAAPDLLEALKAIKSDWSQGYGASLKTEDLIDAAIAKAEGGKNVTETKNN